jgi:hypothetical protein
MSYASLSVVHPGGWVMQFEIDWSGSSVRGRGPDDSTPDIDDVHGWLETASGFFVRDFLPRELDELWDGGSSKIADLAYERIHEAYNDSDWEDY